MSHSDELKRLADRAREIRLQDPYFRLRAGLPIERLRLGTLSEAEADATTFAGVATAVEALNTGALSHTDRLTRGFLLHLAAESQAAEQGWWEQFPITPYAAYVFSMYPQQVFQPFQFNDAADGERYLALARDYAGMIETAANRLRRQAERGWRIPRPALAGARIAIERAKAFATAAMQVDVVRAGPASADLPDRVARLVAAEIAPAFDRLIDLVGLEYETAAVDAVGLCHFVGGEAAYRRAIHSQLTLAVEPEALHERGLDEVARITAEMAELRAKTGWNADEAIFHAELHHAPKTHATSPDEVERTYLGHMERMRPQISDYFRVLPKAEFGVQRLAPEMEAGMTYGYYEAPLRQGEPGLYHYNGSGLDSRLQLNAAALIFHELAPGHHFHLARQAENTALPAIRREAIELAVFNEGWAEYASSLGLEMGLYDDPYDHYGRLIHERFIAQRLVVDTGLNAFGWSLEKARAYMKAQTLESDAQVATETLRYSTDMPAQALAYHYGFLKFWELRRKAEAKAGAAFDIRDHHEAILSQGALPLAVLDENMLADDAPSSSDAAQ